MNFFEHQGRARRKTFWLLTLFALALVSIVALVDLIALFFLGTSPDRFPPDLSMGLVRQRFGLLFWVSIATAGGILLASQYRVLSLRGGGGTVARGLGGTLVTSDTTDPLHRRLRNVVEEMAIASGIPVPELYVLEKEPGINAFAAGYSPADAAMAVTQGTLEILDRDELQGVVAHEFGHILNGDMRLNIRLIGILYGILGLSLLGRLMLNARTARRSNSRDGSLGAVGIGLALLLVGYVGHFFASLIKASVSRQREFLADASAVQFTRQPSGLSGALKKIGASNAGSVLSANADEIAHMLFAKGLSRQLFATHPPLVERIRAIEPRFDARELATIAKAMHPESRSSAVSAGDEVVAGLTGGAAAAYSCSSRLDAETIIRQMGQPGPMQVMAAGRLAAAIPAPLERAARAAAWAPAVVCYLLMDANSEIRERQLLMVVESLGPEVERQVGNLLAAEPQLAPELRIPLLEIVFPALRRRPERDLTALLALVDRLIHADSDIELFEYALAKLLVRQVEDALFPTSAGIHGRGRLSDCTHEVVDLLTILAHHGHADAGAAVTALAAGMHRLGAKPDVVSRIKEAGFKSDWLGQEWSARLDAALDRLDQVRLEDRQRLLGAMVATVAADGEVASAELDLLRAVCAALQMPLPVLDSVVLYA
jgi:Zn-dependent protease with chaperone function